MIIIVKLKNNWKREMDHYLVRLNVLMLVKKNDESKMIYVIKHIYRKYTNEELIVIYGLFFKVFFLLNDVRF